AAEFPILRRTVHGDCNQEYRLKWSRASLKASRILSRIPGLSTAIRAITCWVTSPRKPVENLSGSTEGQNHLEDRTEGYLSWYGKHERCQKRSSRLSIPRPMEGVHRTGLQCSGRRWRDRFHTGGHGEIHSGAVRSEAGFSE